MCEGRENCLKYLKRGWKGKERRGNKDFKKGGGSWVKGWVPKKVVGAGTPSQTNYDDITSYEGSHIEFLKPVNRFQQLISDRSHYQVQHHVQTLFSWTSKIKQFIVVFILLFRLIATIRLLLVNLI